MNRLKDKTLGYALHYTSRMAMAILQERNRTKRVHTPDRDYNRNP